ncbi:MAG: hypothetical protein AB7F22_30490 [Reyranella sp.]|uniref:hypothetical protein n=1 Tax=Reyranella sp. TaxID=1929291 RepID=UPI003D141566
MRNTIAAALSLAAVSVAAAASAAPSPADIAASNEAMRAFMAHRQNCGDKIVTAIDVNPPQGGFAAPVDASQAKPNTLYVESSGLEPQWSGQGGKMTEADRLNGLQWKGGVQIFAKAARHISVTRGGGPNGAWSQWQSSFPLGTVEIEQRHGVWSTKEYWQLLVGLGRFGKQRRPSCSEVPA